MTKRNADARVAAWRHDFRLYWLAGALGTTVIAVETAIGPLAGVIADRWSRRALMVGSAIAAVLAFGALSSAVVTHQITLPLLFAVTVVESGAAATYSAPARGAIRAILPRTSRTAR